MIYDFDNVPDRRHTNSVKWDLYAEDVLPLWVADTDFPVCPKIIDAMTARINHPVMGYSLDSRELKKVVCEREKKRYGWEIHEEDLILVPGIVSGFNFAVRAFCSDQDSVIFQTPAYPPFISAPGNFQLEGIQNELVWDEAQQKYVTDFDEFESQIKENTSLFILCNPQNPTGRAYTPEELLKFGEICRKHNVLICSDEIHSEIVYKGNKHTPIASLNEDLAQHTITFIAPSKTFNIAGLSCSVAIVQNPELREKFARALDGLCSGVIGLSQEAAIAAYRDSDDWLEQCMDYLEANRDFALDYIQKNMPAIHVAKPEATFLLWLDCSACGIEGNAAAFFEKNAKVALNNGAAFSKNCEKFVRLNIGTSRAILTEALERMSRALK